MLHRATDAERDAMERLAQAERVADEARENLLAVIRRERERERSSSRLHRLSASTRDAGTGRSGRR